MTNHRLFRLPSELNDIEIDKLTLIKKSTRDRIQNIERHEL